MTLLQKLGKEGTDTMDGQLCLEHGDKSARPVRSRRHTRRSFASGQRPQKRLFTPEIKRYLKDWLVRRRENPYPNRDEKKILAHETGLTYIQICNWFANWRRKLKNVNMDRNQQTWGHLIRTYNDRAQGNVEQFSISSDDSIWSEPGTDSLDNDAPLEIESEDADSTVPCADTNEESDSSSVSMDQRDLTNNNTYKPVSEPSTPTSNNIASPLLLSKWLESAARFRPSESNYSLWGDRCRRKPEAKIQRTSVLSSWSKHDQDEVEAAVALTALASAANRVTAP